MPDLTELTAKDWSDNDDHELIFKLLEIIGCPCKTNAIINNFLIHCVVHEFKQTALMDYE